MFGKRLKYYMAIEFRQANKDDLYELGSLEVEIFSDPWGEATLANYLESSEKDKAIYVLFDGVNEKILAYVIIQTLYAEIEIMRFAVVSNRRREGLGKRLMNTLKDVAKDHEVKKIILEVNSINYKAINLYESLGFIEVGRRKDYYKQGEDALLMDLNIA